MILTASLQQYASKPSPNSKIHRWYMNMAKINIKLYCATCSSNILSINHRQANLSCESIVNAAFNRSRIDQGKN